MFKVVMERESIRTLCDKLRRERDRAVSELAEALRDSDDVKKQGSESRIKTGSAQGSLVKASMTEILEYFDTLRLPGIEL